MHYLSLRSWSKTSDLNHFSKTKEEQNQTLYSPSPAVDSSKGAITSSIWSSFVVNINDVNTCDDSVGTSKTRLPFFVKMETGCEDIIDDLPFIEPAEASLGISSSLSESTWREVLLGEGDAWEKTIRSHKENERSKTGVQAV